jgi:hypothetical protein
MYRYCRDGVGALVTDEKVLTQSGQPKKDAWEYRERKRMSKSRTDQSDTLIETEQRAARFVIHDTVPRRQTPETMAEESDGSAEQSDHSIDNVSANFIRMI